MSSYFSFDCGCKFPISEQSTIPKIVFDPNIDHINLSCSRTWELISEGNTKGCFQLESRLGQSMAKKLKPENIEQLSALISILRPGCLEAYRDGKSVSNHYIDRKNGLEAIDYFHPALEPILKATYGEMCFQEQAMEIAKSIAGFNLQDADELRKAIGKKQADKMAKVKKQFIDGCARLSIVTTDEAEQIFGWIEKSQRYLFNASHAVSYAINAYLSAYAKAHFPRIFFASYLRYAKDKIDPQQEIKELVRNASSMGISIRIPDLRNMNEFFYIKDKEIYFGLTDIKSVGASVYKKLVEICKDRDLSSLSWYDILIDILLNINSAAAKSLISCGALDFNKKTRTEMLFELDIVSSLTDKEIEKLNELRSSKSYKNLAEVLTDMLTTFKLTTKRKETISNLINTIKNPPFSLTDKIEWISDSENSLLGVALTCSKLDTYDTTMTNTDCKTFKTSVNNKNIIIAGEISSINFVKTKRGKNPGQEMAFIGIEDSVGILDSLIMFPEQLAEYKHHLFEGNILVFFGDKTKTGDGLVVSKCFEPMT